MDLCDELEATTRAYGTPILITETVYGKLSDEWKQTCRKVDRVVAEGGSEPFDVYAANVASIEGNYWDPSIKEDVWPIVEDVEITEKRHFAMKQIETGALQKLPKKLRVIEDERWKNWVDDWNDGFEAGVELYIAGKWVAAKAALEEVLATREWDGPTQKILNYMKNSCAPGGQAPDGWEGFSRLDSPHKWVSILDSMDFQ